MLKVTCVTGGEHVVIRPEDPGQDPHSRLDAAGCTHCADGRNADPDHHHAACRPLIVDATATVTGT